MKIKERKLTVWIVDTIILVGLFILTLFFAPTGLDIVAFLIFTVLMIVLLGITYIGGNALATWAKSKYFHSELVGK